MSEPDRYDKRVGELARHVEELIFDGDEECGSRLRWSLRRMTEEVEAETLERAAQVADKEGAQRTSLGLVGQAACITVAHNIRALASPAAAPAAGEPSEPAAPAPLRRMVERAQVELNQRDARIAKLEAALRELTRAATEHANAHGCSGDLGARLSDARALLAARTSQGWAGEGT